MFNRLIIAVLTLGLLLSFSSAAFCSDNHKVGKNAYETFNANAPRVNDLREVHTATSSFDKPASALSPLETPSAVLPPQYMCEGLSYDNGPAYFWRSPDDYNDYEQGVRYTPSEGYSCTLLTAWVAIYGTEQGLNVGAPDMLVTVYADDGFGLPGTALGTVVVPNAALPTAGLAYVGVDLSTANGGGPFVFDFVSGGMPEEFHIGYQCDNWTDGDTLFFLSDDGSAADVRSWENYGVYATMLDDWGGNYSFLMDADVCNGLIPFTECYEQYYAPTGAAYYWTIPDPYADDYFNMRFSVDGPETLTEIGLAFYGAEAVGAQDIIVYVWPSLGGFPDLGNEFVAIPMTVDDFYPAFESIDLTSLNMIMTGDFHVGYTVVDQVNSVVAILSDDGANGTGRSSEYYGAWGTMVADWGVDVNFLIYADLCIDQFAICKTINYTCGLSSFWRLPDRYGDIGDYQRFSPEGEGCRLEKGRIAFYWASSEAALPLYTYNSEFQIYGTDLAGVPDPSVVYNTTTITPADYVLYPGWTEVDYTLLPDPILFDEDIWFGVESFAPDTLSGIRTLSDDGSCGSLRSAENWAGEFYFMLDDWGTDLNFLMEIDVCCVPVDERVCYAGDDWPTFGRDFARSGASFSAIGPDAQSNLSMAWRYSNDPTQTLLYNPPSIYGDTMVAYFGNELVAIDMNDGTEIWVKPADGFEVGAGGTITPTIYNFDAYGTTETYVFFGGCDAKSFNCYDLTDGSTVWTRNFMQHSMHFMSFGPNVIIDCGGTPVVVYADDDGDIYAVEALTGNMYAGWAVNPISFGGNIHTNMAADTEGGTIFVGTYASGVTPGTVFAFDACTGAAIWEFTEHQMDVFEPDNLDDNAIEEFQSGIMYDKGVLYAPSMFALKFVVAGAYVTGGGLMYQLDAASGAMNWAQIGRQVWDGIHLSLDANQVIASAWNDWNNPGFHELSGVWAYQKSNGNILFKHTQMSPGPWDLIGMGTVLSCEPDGVPDWIVATTRWNFINFFRSSDGAQMFHRRWAGYFSPNSYAYGHPSGQVMSDGRLLVFGRQNVVCLTSADETPRSRLDINGYQVDVVVPFGMPDHTLVTAENVIGNLGGAPLTIDGIFLADEDNGLLPDNGDITAIAVTAIGDDRLDRIEKLTRMYGDAFADNVISDVDVARSNGASRSNSAYAVPAWVYGITTPTAGTVIPPQGAYNDSSNYIDIVVDINGTLVPRGLTAIFVDIYTDDPDYFLDSAKGTYAYPADTAMYATPQVRLNLVGGCLFEDVVMEFGVGGANTAHVWNSTKLADGDIASITIDGDASSFWQGGYVFSKAQSLIVPPGKVQGLWSGHTFLHQDGWSSGSVGWESILPDPNCYDATCAPNHRTNVLLGEMSHDDGASYDPVYGEVVAYSFVDSAQDACTYDTLGVCVSWNWNDISNGVLSQPLLDSLTLGFRGCVEVIGAYDEPDLAQFMIHRMELSGRYAAINDLYIGAIIDYDIPTSDFDVSNYDADHNLAYQYPCNTKDNAWGSVRIPFGCGYEGMQGAKTVTANQGGWSDSGVWLDSITAWMTGTVGLMHQPGTDPALCTADSDDREAWHVFGAFDLPVEGSGTATLGAAWFGIPDFVGDASDASLLFDLADMANKWSGFGRGDVNNDGAVNLVDIAYMIDYVYYGGNGPFPFLHLGDVDASGGDPDAADIAVLVDYYFNMTGCIMGDWTLGGYVAVP
jgi:hypothetical protein